MRFDPDALYHIALQEHIEREAEAARATPRSLHELVAALLGRPASC